MASNENSSSFFDFYKRKEATEKAVNSDFNLQDVIDKINNSHKLQIVILDVDEKSMSRLSSLLKPRYDVHCITNDSLAMQLIKTKKIALVISDQALPNLNTLGVDFLLKTKKIAEHTSRILLAGPLDFGKAKLSLTEGDVFKLIKKPFDSERMLTVIEQAIEAYLEKSGSLASAATKLQHSSNLTKDVKVAKMIPASANPVLVKCSNKQLFEEIKANYTDNALFIHAETTKEAISILQENIIKSVIYFFEQEDVIEESSTDFLTHLKQELTYLTVLAVMDKDKANYKEIMALLSDNVIYDYFSFNVKVQKICQQLSSAIELSNRLYENPIYLKWPPVERVEETEEEESIGDALKEVTSKVKDGVMSGLQSFREIFKKKN